MIEINHHKYSFPKVLTFGFIFVILIGTFLLMLPISTNKGLHTSFMTALFTSTSATCVTGITLVDTATHWSWFGKLVITLLIEIGGLGFMTFTVLMFLLIRGKMSMSTKLLTSESLNLSTVSQFDIVYLVLKLSVAIQIIGAGLLFVDFYPRYGFQKGLAFSIFHSISAFCNAGFDLFGNSVQNFANNTYVLGVFAFLILAGSLGFLVWKDILTYRQNHRLSLHTTLALRTGLVLFTLSFVMYLITENNLSQLADQLDVKQRLVNTIFMAITPRTAGLITFPYNELTTSGMAFTIMLMFIGGTPGSTAGGIKTTTVGLLVIQSISTLKGQQEPTFAHRRFSQENIFRAIALIWVALVLVIAAIVILTKTQALPKHDTLEYVTFEVVAAFGTTGISLGVTQYFDYFGQAIIMVLMFIGRVGIYTVMYSILNAKPKQKSYHYPKEDILIG